MAGLASVRRALSCHLLSNNHWMVYCVAGAPGSRGADISIARLMPRVNAEQGLGATLCNCLTPPISRLSL